MPPLAIRQMLVLLTRVRQPLGLEIDTLMPKQAVRCCVCALLRDAQPSISSAAYGSRQSHTCDNRRFRSAAVSFLNVCICIRRSRSRSWLGKTAYKCRRAGANHCNAQAAAAAAAVVAVGHAVLVVLLLLLALVQPLDS